MESKKILASLFIAIVGLIVSPNLGLSNQSGGVGGNSEEIETLNKKIADKRQKVQELEESIAQVKKDINQQRLKTVSLTNQMAILDNHAKQVELDITVTQEKLDTLELEITALTLQIEEKETDVTRQKELIAELVRTLHYENGKSYIEIMAAYDNFSDFYNRLQYLQTVEQDLGKNARGLRLAKVDLEEQRTQTEKRQLTYEDLKRRLDEREHDLEEQRFIKEDLLAQTRASELTFQTLLNNLRRQYQEIEGEIATIEREVRRRLEEQEKLGRGLDPRFGDSFFWPTQSRYITAQFHDPDYPYRHIFEHNGIDIRASQGTPIKAAGAGYVAQARQCSSPRCYSYVMLIHSGGLATVYGHLSSVAVAADQFVTRGDVLGYSGGTPGTDGAGPFVTGPHLHFEVRQNGIPVDPAPYLVVE